MLLMSQGKSLYDSFETIIVAQQSVRESILSDLIRGLGGLCLCCLGINMV